MAARHDQMRRTRAKSCAQSSRSFPKAPNLPQFRFHVFLPLSSTQSCTDFCTVAGAPLEPHFEQPFRMQTSNAPHGCGTEAGPPNSCQFQRPFTANHLTAICMPFRSHGSWGQQNENLETHKFHRFSKYDVSICQKRWKY